VKRVLKWIGMALGAVALVLTGAVVFAVLTAEQKLHQPETPYPKLAAVKDPDVIARGKYLVYGPAHCAQCHSVDDRTKPELVKTEPLHGGLEFAMGPIATTYARNLTSDEKTGLGKFSDEEIARAIRTGVMPDGNLSFFMRVASSRLADEDVVAILSYLRSLEPVEREVPRGEWHLLGKVLLKYAFPPLVGRPLEGPAYVAASDEPTIERGKYLVEDVMLCADCHTAMDPMTFAFVGQRAGGGIPEASHGADSDKEFVTPNLTSHPTGFTGKMDEDMFLARMRAGRAIETSIMPWEGFQLTTESDLRSVYRYLKSLPPVDNDVGPTYRDIGWTKPAT